MMDAINFNHLPIKDLVISALIIFLMSTIISNIYNPLLGFTYALGNIITLTFLSWLYKDTWSETGK
tara:strand:+ start:250 stop:447 length:198 start_codon:yes stop_codon:yes gene_type:complete